MWNSAIILNRQLPSSLICLKAENCASLESLPDLSSLKLLRTLSLRNCNMLAEIQGLDGMESLEFLDLIGCIPITVTPTEVHYEVLSLSSSHFSWKLFNICHLIIIQIQALVISCLSC